MTLIRIVVFIIGIILIRYVGGIPNDSKNFFITQFLFFISFLLDYHRFISLKHKVLKIIVYIGYIAGFFVLLLNILGIFEIVTISNEGANYYLYFNTDYHLGNIQIGLIPYMNVGAIIYFYIFITMITFKHKLKAENELPTRGVLENARLG